METTIKVERTRTLFLTKKMPERAINNFWQNAEYNRFGIISMLLVILGCAGGIAAGFGAQADVLKLVIVAFPTSITLALVLSISPMKAIFYASAIAIFLDFVILVL